MTAEIAIMNKSAVALAADSAATVFIGTGEHKIYNTVNKLFMLSKHHPVGIMVYGGAELMGVPWETIIKLYRKGLGSKSFDYIKDYAKDFISFLENENPIFDSEIETKFFQAHIHTLFMGIRQSIDSSVQKLAQSLEQKKRGKIPQRQVRSITKDSILSHYKTWSELKTLPHINGDYSSQLASRYDGSISDLIDAVFEKLFISQSERKKLVELARLYFIKDRFNVNCPGIVVAGFGEKEIFPSLVSFRAECLILNILKHNHASMPTQEVKISLEHPSHVEPFAQHDVVWTFLRGVEIGNLQVIEDYLSNVFRDYPNEIQKAVLPNASPDEAEKFKEKIRKINDAIVVGLGTRFGERVLKHHIGPIYQAIANLPKDELSALAESLINITSLKRRVSMSAETVGGPIDVAVISKCDGFIWIKRKHYFKPELNRYSQILRPD